MKKTLIYLGLVALGCALNTKFVKSYVKKAYNSAKDYFDRKTDEVSSEETSN